MKPPTLVRIFLRSFFLPVLVLFLSAASAFAAPSRREALAAIAVMERDILGENAGEAARVITQFVEESDDVTCTLSPDTAPWVTGQDNPDEVSAFLTSRLLAMYIAGNAKAQLGARKAEDDPYSGWVAALRAYRQIQAKREFSLPELDELAEMEAKGSLKRHGDEVKAKIKEALPEREAPAPRKKGEFIE